LRRPNSLKRWGASLCDYGELYRAYGVEDS
jgi:hypothetical protein